MTQDKIKELKKEIERCDNAKDGDEHFSKENWELRGQFCRGKLEGIQNTINQLREEIERIFNLKEFEFDGLIHGTICCSEYGCDEVIETYKKWLKRSIRAILDAPPSVAGRNQVSNKSLNASIGREEDTSVGESRKGKEEK